MKEFKKGDKFKLPKSETCGHKGRIVGIYELNGSEKTKTIFAVKCNKYHQKDEADEKSGINKKGITVTDFSEDHKGKKNVIYLIDVSDIV